MSTSYILGINALWDTSFAKIAHSVYSLFVLLKVSFSVQKFLL